ncbi:hypothetical protein EGW08_005333 [Elysia chlorotica]|uniref:BHLH domain-containing protein n=1 Tax=Elysia chlorotica TaxID=188477 RepID=A0A433TZM4_ELYCH|nr:hypothetical protein EGW08_005333 [Elysia chlorotica]
MEQTSEKKKKTKQSKSPTISDSSYGSMITGTSSSSSLSLSLFSESDLAEGPSTSGCSSEMATAMRSKERKKERAKEFMKKLKSMLPNKKNVGKMDTLSTLEQLVDSMRQLNENEKKNSDFKTPPPHTGSYHSADTDKLAQSNMFISVSPKSHVVQKASGSLMEHLGYPVDWWKGRLLKDFLKKKDTNTVNSCLAQHSADDDCGEISGKVYSKAFVCYDEISGKVYSKAFVCYDEISGKVYSKAFVCYGEISESIINSSTEGTPKDGSNFFYARIRRFRKLGEGFNLQNIVSYCPFRMMVTSKPLDASDSEEDGSGRHRRSLIIYCSPLTSAYIGGAVSGQKRFSLRHSLHCNFVYIDPNTVSLLGFLPQDLNGIQIFELYHQDYLPMLLDVHKKIMQSMGQPFKSEPMKLRTRNGCYVEVETEWSSFINPLSMRLEFIIGQHTVLKPPSSPDLFEDLMMTRPGKMLVTPEMRKIQEKILDVLKKPVQNTFAEPSPVALPIRNRVSANLSSVTPMHVGEAKDSEATTKSGSVAEKSKDETSSAESKSAIIDEKGISSIYNQLNYSHNIKRFLMSHPKSFSNVSDEDSVIMRDDSEDENINEEEELPLEIPVVKPPSCGSSTQVHVSEPGHGEDISGVAPFGDETSNLPREVAADSRHFLTEETLKKHTKMQERLYLQRISEEQPLIINTRRRKSRNTSHQKRPRPKEMGEDVNSAKHPCTNSGVFRSSSNIFMQSFPVIKETDDWSCNQGNMGLPQQPAIHLVPSEAVPISCIPTSLATMVPTQGLVDMGSARPRQNIQWPYYPQAGYTLLPQVMTGFYQPMLQTVQMNQSALMQYPKRPAQGAMEIRAPDSMESGENGKRKQFDKKGNYCDNNQSSSVEDTTSSIIYLLDADSSTLEDSDHKHSVQAPAPSCWMHNKRAMEPPWLCGINWNTDTKMRYQMPQPKMSTVLKMDEKRIMNTQQSEIAQQNLEQLLEDVAASDFDHPFVSASDFDHPFDEEVDYIFFPGDEPLDESDLSAVKSVELEMSQPQNNRSDQVHGGGGKEPDKGGGGGGGSGRAGGEEGTPHTGEVEMGGDAENGSKGESQENGVSANCEEVHTPEDVWNLTDESADTPTKSCSEDEKGEITPSGKEEKKKNSSVMKAEEKVDQTTEDHGDGGDITMETVFCRRNSSRGTGDSSLDLVAKRGSSPKDGSLSGDECSGSDGGQKMETEDAQSSCSKESSDLTPSEVRSNEEAGSSLKESDSSLKMVKEGPLHSVASPSSSTDQMVQEDVGGGRAETLVADLEEVFQKLFVPLKIRVSHRMSPRTSSGPAGREREGGVNARTKRHSGGSSQSAPYWLLEAHMSKRVAMTYKVPMRPLEDVLMEDSRRMTDLVQSATVRQQLLQLLGEVDLKAGANPSSQTASASNPSSSCIPPPAVNPSTDASTNDSIPLLSVSPTTQSPPIQTDLQPYTDSEYPCFTANKLIDNSSSRSKPAGSLPMSPLPSEDSLVEAKSMKFLSLRSKSVSNVSMESMPSALIGGDDSSPIPQHCYREMNFSDTNSEPAGEKSGQNLASLYSQSSSTEATNAGCDSAGNESTGLGVRLGKGLRADRKSERQRQEAASKVKVARVDSHLNEKFKALESKCLGEQGIEDVIMSKVFLSGETMASAVGSRVSPDLRGNINILD